jgi:hypothetical protein
VNKINFIVVVKFVSTLEKIRVISRNDYEDIAELLVSYWNNKEYKWNTGN